MKNYKLSQNGVGLIALLIATGIIVAIAAIVATFVTQQNRLSSRVQTGGACQVLANSLRDYIQKDEANVFITSFGPTRGTNNFPTAVNMTADGKDQFTFAGTALRAVTPPGTLTGLTLADSSGAPVGGRNNVAPLTTAIAAGWQFNNHMNLRNSMTRLIALTTQNPKMCCEEVDDVVDDGSCGIVVYERTAAAGTTTQSIDGFITQEPNVEVKIAANFENEGSSICNGGDLEELPRGPNAFGEFSVRVRLNANLANEQVCVSSGRLRFTDDTTPPTTIVMMSSETANTLCGGPAGGGAGSDPLICSAYTAAQQVVKLKAWTITTGKVGDAATTAFNRCRTTLLTKFPGSNYNCQGTDADIMNRCYDLVSTNSPLSDPGSTFLCRFGEENWFNANSNYWEPCELAKVYECTGGAGSTCTGRLDTGATVTIHYNQRDDVAGAEFYNNLQSSVTRQTSRTTAAIVTMTNFKNNRRYKFDMRAVDTGGTSAGPSFCQFMGWGNTCNYPGYGFVKLEDGPTTITPLSSNEVATSGNIATIPGGTVTNAGAQSALGARLYQCEMQSSTFTATYHYGVTTEPWISGGFNSETCDPNGADYCDCAGGICTVGYTPTGFGQQNINVIVRNKCNTAGINSVANWCLVDKTTPFNVNLSPQTANSTNLNMGTASLVTPASACEEVYVCPRIGGGESYSVDQPCVATTHMNWNALANSGCVAQPGGYPGYQLCVKVIDPCGRAKDSNKTTYSTTLANSVDKNLGPDTVGSCGAGGGGNACDPGANWCGRDLKCHPANQYEYFGQTCSEITSFLPNMGAGSPDEACYYSGDLSPGVGAPPDWCGGDDYLCTANYNSTNYTENKNSSDCAMGTNACSVSNDCSYAPGRRCSNDTAISCTTSPDSSVADCGAPGRCTVRVGTCGKTGEACNDLTPTCPALPGTCTALGAGTCKAPTNNTHPGGAGPRYCPDLNSCDSTPCSWVPDPVTCVGACGSTSGTQTPTATCPCGTCTPAVFPSTPTACTKSVDIGPTGNVCGFHWQRVSAGTCTGPCGPDGTRTVTYQCEDGAGAVTSAANCAGAPGGPSAVESCIKPNSAVDETGAACACSWQASPTSACSGPCGTMMGRQNVSWTCAGGAACSSTPGYCAGVAQPATWFNCVKSPNVGPTGNPCSPGFGECSENLPNGAIRWRCDECVRCSCSSGFGIRVSGGCVCSQQSVQILCP